MLLSWVEDSLDTKAPRTDTEEGVKQWREASVAYEQGLCVEKESEVSQLQLLLLLR